MRLAEEKWEKRIIEMIDCMQFSGHSVSLLCIQMLYFHINAQQYEMWRRIKISFFFRITGDIYMFLCGLKNTVTLWPKYPIEKFNSC